MKREFRERLKNIRIERGISLEELANASGISVAFLQKVEGGKKTPRFSYPVIEKIAEVLDVDVKELINVQIV